MYKIVIFDKENGEVKDIVDVNFPFSQNGGRFFDISILMAQDYNSHGEPRNSHNSNGGYESVLSVGEGEI